MKKIEINIITEGEPEMKPREMKKKKKNKEKMIKIK